MVAAAAGALASLTPPAAGLEETVGLARLFTWRGPVEAPSDVIVVGIGRDSAEALGLSTDLTEWPRSLHTRLIEALHAAGASVIAFDIHFAEPRNAADDSALAGAIRDAGGVLLLDWMKRDVSLLAGPADSPQQLIRERRERPIAELHDAAAGTLPFPLPVVPIRVYQFWSFLPTAGDAPTLPVAALQLHLRGAYGELVALIRETNPGLAADLPLTTESLQRPGELEAAMHSLRRLFRQNAGLADDLRARLSAATRSTATYNPGASVIALIDAYAGPESRYVNYFGPPRSIRTVPYYQALDADRMQPGFWLGKTVFVGFSEQTQPDQQDAFYSVYSQNSGLNLSGVEIGATAFANLLASNTVRPLSRGRQLALVLLFGFVAGAALGLLPTAVAIAAAIVIGGGYFGAALRVFTTDALWLPVVTPLMLQLPIAALAVILWNYAAVRRQRARIEHGASRFLPPEIVAQFGAQADDAEVHSRHVRGTCMVTDAASYTALAEQRTPAEIRQLLNAYYEVLFEIVHRHGGTVTDVVGDSMVAVWHGGAPGHDQANAARAALEISRAMPGDGGAADEASLPTRIGLHSGEFLLGTLGTSARLAYRAIGDTINSASRIEELNKQLGTRILASFSIAPAEADLAAREIGTFVLAGKDRPLPIFELLAGSRHPRESWPELRLAFSAALDALRAGRWQEAERAFRAIERRFGVDGPSGYYAELAARFTASGRPSGWDGIIRLDRK